MSTLTQQRLPAKHSGRSEASIKRAYSFSDLSTYSPKERFLIRAAAFVFYLIISLVGRTVRFQLEGEEHLQALESGGYVPIFNSWHNRSFLAIYWLRQRKIAALTSKSFDGEYISRLIQHFGFGAVRGSSTRGGAGALVEMARLMRAGFPAALTPDGPRGPLYEVKMGSVLLAKKTGNPILPIMVTAARCWRLPSWDSYRIPKPFTQATVRLGRPIFVPGDAGEALLEEKRKELKRALKQISD
ncbi:MAG TPA: lysophospholipid acyltransferase family protein [Pyrinomonadaceae bacterium]|nr:lysophospholipid acyltransferase family protein [Pyrinomonadaceae bacterium]